MPGEEPRAAQAQEAHKLTLHARFVVAAVAAAMSHTHLEKVANST